MNRIFPATLRSNLATRERKKKTFLPRAESNAIGGHRGQKFAKVQRGKMAKLLSRYYYRDVAMVLLLLLLSSFRNESILLHEITRDADVKRCREQFVAGYSDFQKYTSLSKRHKDNGRRLGGSF